MTRSSPAWLEYEKTIFEYLHVDHPEAEVVHNALLPGHLSGIRRQIDVLVTETISDAVFRTAFEAKHYSKKVDVKGVEEAIGLFQDVGVNRGVLVTTKGYTDAALQRANADDLDIDLDILDLSDLGSFQTDGMAIPYKGQNGAAIPAPLGWIIDCSRTEWGLARMYRRGLTFQEAHNVSEFMYVQIWDKEAEPKTLDGLIAEQNKGILHHFPKAEVAVDHLNLGRGRKGAMRTASGMYVVLEVTAFAEFAKFILFITLITPKVVLNRNRRKLEYVIRKALPFTITDTPQA
jgi:hypothetical protein